MKQSTDTKSLRTMIGTGYVLIILQIGGLTGFVILLLLSYTVIHRKANRMY